LQIVPADQCRDLTDLVALGLALLLLEVDQLRSRRPDEHAMAPPAAYLSQAKGNNEAHQITEVDVCDVASEHAVEEARRLHDDDGNDAL
jgi:hypothetical protein